MKNASGNKCVFWKCILIEKVAARKIGLCDICCFAVKEIAQKYF